MPEGFIERFNRIRKVVNQAKENPSTEPVNQELVNEFLNSPAQEPIEAPTSKLMREMDEVLKEMGS